MTNDRKHGYLYAKTDEGNFRLIGKMVEKDRGNSEDSTDVKGGEISGSVFENDDFDLNFMVTVR